MASISSILPSPGALFNQTTTPSSKSTQTLHCPCYRSSIFRSCYGSPLKIKTRPPFQFPLVIRVSAAAVAEETSSSLSEEEAARRIYIGNIPRNLNNDELRRIVEEHGAVLKAEVMYDKYSGRSRRFGFATMKTVEDANAVVENLNGKEIGGRQIKVNVTEKPLQGADLSLVETEESQFVDSPHKVYVGNLAKTVTTDMLRNFFLDKGTVLSAKVQRAPGTSKSSGYGFISFSSDEEVEAAISAFNNTVLEGQKIRVNKA